MIVADRPLNVVESGIKSRQFGIKLTPKMFRILSADLYSDKVRAVVRELSTNAADAHVAAGKKDVPFLVHLPNAMEPWFEVKDFGTGLDSEAIYAVYTQYGASDKTNSNEYTGCLGLGSKSPFAYTDSFTVESRVNGKVSAYTAYLNGEGFPTLSDPLTIADTKEPNGLTVRFPVKASDYAAFCDKAVETLKWFATKPKVSGNVAFYYPEPTEYVRKTDKYAVVKRSRDNYYNRNNNSFVVMGNVAYPIDADQIANYYAKGEDGKVRQLLNWGVELYVKIGDVDITASRESLSYDDDEANQKRTVPFIKKACLEALKDLTVELTKDIDTKPTLWAAREALHEIKTDFAGLDITGTWKGTPITDKVSVPADKAVCESLKRTGYRSDKLTVKKENVAEMTADGSVIFLNDGRGGYAAVRRYLADKKDSARVYLLNETADAAWLKETGIDKVLIKTSTLPKPERIVGARGTAQKAKVYEWQDRGRNRAAADHWTPVELDLEDDGDYVYVEIAYFKFKQKPGDEMTREPFDLRYTIDTLKTVSGKDLKVYGIRPSDKALMEKSEGTWIPLHEYAEKVQKEASVTLHADALLNRQFSAVGRNVLERMERFKFAEDSSFGAFIKKLKLAEKASKNPKVNEYVALCGTVGVTFKDTDVASLNNEAETVYAKYPLLKFLDSWNNCDEMRKAAAEYVKLMDGKDAEKGGSL